MVDTWPVFQGQAIIWLFWDVWFRRLLLFSRLGVGITMVGRWRPPSIGPIGIRTRAVIPIPPVIIIVVKPPGGIHQVPYIITGYRDAGLHCAH